MALSFDSLTAAQIAASVVVPDLLRLILQSLGN